jgi:putative transcriptional regulator
MSLLQRVYLGLNHDQTVEAQVTLRKLREERKMSREELALAVGVTYSTVANLEAGRFKPRIDLAIKIARVFGVPVESIDWGKPSASDDDASESNSDD